MTRATMKRKLRWLYAWLFAVLVVAFAAKLSEGGWIPEVWREQKDLGKAIYEYIKDMAVVIFTIAGAYLAGVFQMRAQFLARLNEAWEDIVGTKSELFTFCERESPSQEDYLRAFCRISETIDSIRIVYRNVGETDSLVGLYPFVPLHDMRRALQTLDPSQGKRSTQASDAERKLVRDAVLQCFYALRETFLDELDLEEPRDPLVLAASQRLKRSGATRAAKRRQSWEEARQGRLERRRDIDRLLQEALDRERAKEAADADARRVAGTGR
jgi:hypothetical protein